MLFLALSFLFIQIFQKKIENSKRLLKTIMSLLYFDGVMCFVFTLLSELYYLKTKKKRFSNISKHISK